MPDAPLRIRPATDADWPALWAIFRAVVATGDTYTYAPDIAEADARRAWTGPGTATYIAERGWRRMGFAVVGTVPEGFRHRKLGYVDLLIMHRRL